MALQYLTTADGAKLAYLDEGTGIPVLALAGLTRSHSDFDFVAPHLRGVRLIRPDYRGRGASDWTGPATYTIQQEAADVVALLDHLGIAKVGLLGTSRGGLIGMALAVTARDRLSGLCLNDIGPVIERAGLTRIADYVGRNPAARTIDELAAKFPRTMSGFANVAAERWRAFARQLYDETPAGLVIRYDPALRESFMAGLNAPPVDLWPLYDACAGLPLALIRGANSDLLSRATADEMARRRPDLIRAEVADRAHVPFLDEAESLAALTRWLEQLP